tara:strand:- start:2383 stop:2877 length:495 start_codon:yes stop_codon:yes gene_type:complete
MDFKLNTLQYLTEPSLLEKLNSNSKKTAHNDEIGFYKKRIFLTTKSLLRNAKINPSVNNAFNNYVSVLIQHFKIVDTNDILQEEFKNILKNDNISKEQIKSVSEIEKEANSYIIEEQRDENEGTLNNFVKTINSKPEEKIIMPKQKIVNLKNPELRNKGINKNK